MKLIYPPKFKINNSLITEGVEYCFGPASGSVYETKAKNAKGRWVPKFPTRIDSPFYEDRNDPQYEVLRKWIGI